jgi:hypothetical protein
MKTKIITAFITAVSLLSTDLIYAEPSPKKQKSEALYTVEVIKAGNKLKTVKVTEEEIVSLAEALDATWRKNLPLVQTSVAQWADIFSNAPPTALCKNLVELTHLNTINESIDVAPAFVNFVNRQFQGAEQATQLANVKCNMMNKQ